MKGNRSMPSIQHFAAVLLLLTATACGEKEKATDESQIPDLQAGQSLWNSTCTLCHGMQGKGVPNMGPAIHNSDYVNNNTDDALVAFIQKGRLADDPNSVMNLEMPPNGGNPMLKKHDLVSVVAFMRTFTE